MGQQTYFAIFAVPRAVSSAGSEHLVYTEGVGGSSPSPPTLPSSLRVAGAFLSKCRRWLPTTNEDSLRPSTTSSWATSERMAVRVLDTVKTPARQPTHGRVFCSMPSQDSVGAITALQCCTNGDLGRIHARQQPTTRRRGFVGHNAPHHVEFPPRAPHIEFRPTCLGTSARTMVSHRPRCVPHPARPWAAPAGTPLPSALLTTMIGIIPEALLNGLLRKAHPGFNT